MSKAKSSGESAEAVVAGLVSLVVLGVIVATLVVLYASLKEFVRVHLSVHAQPATARRARRAALVLALGLLVALAMAVWLPPALGGYLALWSLASYFLALEILDAPNRRQLAELARPEQFESYVGDFTPPALAGVTGSAGAAGDEAPRRFA